MKTKEFTALVRKLLPNLPGFTVKGQIAFKYPLRDILQGLYFEGSSFDTHSFYIWVFLLPLCIPTKHVSFNIGFRVHKLDKGDRWDISDPQLITELTQALQEQAMPFLQNDKSPSSIIEIARSFKKESDPYVQQAIAYMAISAGNIRDGHEELNKLCHMLDSQIPWQKVMLSRAQYLQGVLLTDFAKAQNQLSLWTAESIIALGLEEPADGR